MQTVFASATSKLQIAKLHGRIDVLLSEYVNEPRTKYFIFGDSTKLRELLFKKRSLRSFHVRDFDLDSFNYATVPRIRGLESPGKPNYVTFDSWADNIRVYGTRMGYTTVLLTDGLDLAEARRVWSTRVDAFATTKDMVDLMLVPIDIASSSAVQLSSVNDSVALIDHLSVWESFSRAGADAMSRAGMPGSWFQYGFSPGQKEPTDFYYLHTVGDVTAILQRDSKSEYLYGMLSSNPHAKQMVFVTSRLTVHPHSAYSTPSFNVKWLSTYLSQMLQWHNDDPHAVRRQIVIDIGGEAITHPDAPDLDGVINVQGRNVPLNISGHLLNYLLLARFYPFCLKRYLDAIAWNYRMVSGVKFTAEEKQLISQKRMAEISNGEYARRVWHNPIEYALAVRAVVALLQILGIRVGELSHGLNQIIKYTKRWAEQFPSLLYKQSLSFTSYGEAGKAVLTEAVGRKLAVVIKLDQLLTNPAVL